MLRRSVLVILTAILTACLLSGCAVSGAEGLFALPRLSDDYLQLENLIAERIDDGGEYAAPVGGRNRQTVQLHDLDGDGAPEGESPRAVIAAVLKVAFSALIPSLVLKPPSWAVLKR